MRCCEARTVWGGINTGLQWRTSCLGAPTLSTSDVPPGAQAWRLAYKRYFKGEIGAEDMKKATASLEHEPLACEDSKDSQQQAGRLVSVSWPANNGVHSPDVEDTAVPPGLPHTEVSCQAASVSLQPRALHGRPLRSRCRRCAEQELLCTGIAGQHQKWDVAAMQRSFH